MSGNLQTLSSSPPGQNISVGWHIVGQLEGHLAPLAEMAEMKNWHLERYVASWRWIIYIKQVIEHKGSL